MSNDFDFDPNAAPEPSPPATDEPAVSEDDAKDKKDKKDKKGKKKGKGKAKAKKPKKEKRPKPGKKKRTKAKKAKPDSSAPQPKQFNIYAAMLLITLLCLTVGSLLLYFELIRYGDFPWWKTDGI